jgi:hypothetical protein
MKRILITTCCLLGLATARGQTLAPTLISSAGASANLFSFGTLDWSVGESVVAIFDNGDVLTQGFHQVFVTVTSMSDEPTLIDQLSLLVYPNPTMQWLNVEASTPVKVRMYNMLGVEVRAFDALAEFHQMDLSQLAAGTYLLEAVQADAPRPQIYKIEVVR